MRNWIAALMLMGAADMASVYVDHVIPQYDLKLGATLGAEDLKSAQSFQRNP